MRCGIFLRGWVGNGQGDSKHWLGNAGIGPGGGPAHSGQKGLGVGPGRITHCRTVALVYSPGGALSSPASSTARLVAGVIAPPLRDIGRWPNGFNPGNREEDGEPFPGCGTSPLTRTKAPVGRLMGLSFPGQIEGRGFSPGPGGLGRAWVGRPKGLWKWLPGEVF